MSRTLALDKPRATIAAATAATVLLLPTAGMQAAAIAVAGAVGWAVQRRKTAAAAADDVPQSSSPSNAEQQGPASTTALAAPQFAPEAVRRSSAVRRAAAVLLLLFAALLIGLPLARGLSLLSPLLSLFESFYRSGALVFGGGHVVMPLLEREVLPNGWASADSFAAGYAAAQAMPGPLFTFASYLGAAAHGAGGAAVATLAIFLPGYLLVLGVLPFWQSVQRISAVAHAVYGINAAVVGLLIATLYDPILTNAVQAPLDFAAAILLFILFHWWKLPPWALVAVSAAGGFFLYS